ncbi:MAG: trypsin-like peptidase domain-containing protein [Betaproteobacteria bacterium]|nr:trypsin-like peptidase domain-containing protein [Betaproteobacteria bacterium]
MQRLWIIFAQTATICLAVLFVISTLKPEWLPARPVPAGDAPRVALVQQAPQPAAGSAQRTDSYHDAVQRATPAVVNIFTTKEVRVSRNPLLNDPLFRRFFGDQLGDDTQRASSLGSGVIVSASGYILTNHHVVEAADEIEVALPDGKKLLARVVGNDPETDLAVLRVEAKSLPAITFGSSDNLRVGDVVLAIGNPFGVGQTVTAGIVSALGRSGLGINVFENFIQTDAPINPGNSGGALIDARGNLVGINTAIYSRTPGGASLGIGFATPVSTARLVLEQIIKSGAVTRGWIGVELQPITPALAESFKLGADEGAIINGVLNGGPADKGGARPGDVLVAIEGKPVTSPQSVLNHVTGLAPGTQAKMKIKRKGQDMELAITVGRRPKPQIRAE